MKHDNIAKISIDDDGRLCVGPGSAEFPYIYREAMEVHWDDEGRFLYGPPPREWSYLDWFKQIVAAANEQSVELRITGATQWEGVPSKLKEEIVSWLVENAGAVTDRES